MEVEKRLTHTHHITRTDANSVNEYFTRTLVETDRRFFTFGPTQPNSLNKKTLVGPRVPPQLGNIPKTGEGMEEKPIRRRDEI